MGETAPKIRYIYSRTPTAQIYQCFFVVLICVLFSSTFSLPYQVEEVRPPHTASSSRSQRELLPSSGCGGGRAPTDSEMCILEMPDSATLESRRRERKERKARKVENHRCRTNESLRGGSRRAWTMPRVPVESESSSSTLTRVTVTVEVERSRQVARAMKIEDLEVSS